MQVPKYTYSQLSSSTVGELVAVHYNFTETNRCKFYVLGLHDNYLIEVKQKKYILRIYRNDWRSPEEIYFELNLLVFLGVSNAQVAAPLPTKSGELCFFIDSPEGKRAGALFDYADGYAPGNEISAEQSVSLGKAVAGVHKITETFTTDYNRPVLDVPYLLDESIVAIEPFIDTEAQNYLEVLQNELKNTLPPLPLESGVFGICIGDVNLSNFHINDKKVITLFDFDQCGFGYRAFEIGKFISSIHSIKHKHDIAKAFIDGYQQIRQLNQHEHKAIAVFERIAVIWVMAIHAYNADRIGYKWLEKPFWDRRLAILKELDNVTHGQKI